MRNLRKLFCIACTVFFFTACEETYNDKLFWPGEISQEYGSYIKPYTLDLTYSGEKLIGKTVSFKTEDSETGTLTLNDVIPGEASTPINGIKLYENEEKGNYTFSGTNITMGGATVKYSGSITPKAMKLDINTQISDKAKLAATYELNTYVWNPEDYSTVGGYFNEIIIKEGEEDNLGFFSIIVQLLPPILNQVLPQVLQDITLAPDGNIIANYSSDPLDMDEIMDMISTEEMVTKIKSRKYQPSPKGLAFWSKTSNKLLVKLNLPAIITEVAKNSNQNIEPQLIAGITDAILKSDPLKLKSMLSIINSLLNNKMLGYLVNTDNVTFLSLFDCIKNGIPLNAIQSEDKHIYLYLDYQTLTPIINVLSGVKISLGEGEPLELSLLFDGWKFLQTFNVGLNIVPITE